MPDRTRPIRKEICLNKQELNLVQHKMRQLGTHNFGAYARKMLIDGYIIKVDYTEQKKLAATVSRVATRIFRELKYSGLIIRKKAGLGQARPHYAELPSGCKAHRKGGRRCTSLTPSSVCRTARSFA